MASHLRTFARRKGAAPFSWAEQQVFRWLEERWRHHLRGRRIPKAMRRRMRAEPHFKMLVARVERREPLVADDLDHVPELERNPDGSVTDRLLDELGEDPRAYFCIDCGEELEEPLEGPCEACRSFFVATERA